MSCRQNSTHKPTPKMFKNLLVPFVFGLALAHTARADPGDTCSTHADCVVSNRYLSTNPYASDQEYCDSYGLCYACDACSYYNDAIDGSCPSKCSGPTHSTYEACHTTVGIAERLEEKCYGGCPPLTKKSGAWCDFSPTQPVCCGPECCQPDGGAIAGIAIGFFVFVTAIVVASCYFCRCGCFRYRRVPAAGGAQQPQVVYVQQAPANVSV